MACSPRGPRPPQAPIFRGGDEFYLPSISSNGGPGQRAPTPCLDRENLRSCRGPIFEPADGPRNSPAKYKIRMTNLECGASGTKIRNMSSARLIDGKVISAQIHSETQVRTLYLREQKGVTPGITFVRVGEDPASRAYVRMKGAKAEELGIRSDTIVLDEKTSQAELLALIDRLNRDPQVHGILVQAPLPRHLNEEEVFSAIDFRKDVDGFHPVNVGKLLLGQNPLFKPCTPAGVHELLIRSDVPPAGADR